MKVAVVGATGLVGSVMIKVLEENGFAGCELIPAASERSVGKEIIFNGRAIRVVGLQDAVDSKPDIALFSAGGSVSKQWAEAFAANSCYVIDNSSAWRMFSHIPLVVPEVNGHVLKSSDHIIANPNCSTIQMVVALEPLHHAYHIKRLVISTYQSVTGTGVKAVNQLMAERRGEAVDMAYPHPIDLNCFPHGGDFQDDGYTTEESKLVNETRKIMSAPNMAITSTVVRIPVVGGHSEAVNIEFDNAFDIQDVKKLLSSAPGIIVQDDPKSFSYPMPRYSEGKNEVFVGRIRRDTTIPNGLNIWVVADNLRKGAATNAVQIAKLLIDKGFVKA
ncbi:MAG: aspartate-semialdehyde dehydrogenase [Bacteroidales bacterium]|nr:aspartate-semialdehyde dehydrogenase [Bacteroidales bacterium]